MIPRLVSGDATSFDNEGLGRFSEAISCKVIEERNGKFELEMSYPVTGHLFQLLETGMLIIADANDVDNDQAFRIYKITTPLNGRVMIYAQHISYDLSGIPVRPMYTTGVVNALNELVVNSMITNPFSVYTDIENTTSAFSVFPAKSFRECLGGSEGSILDVFSGPSTGEFKWDNFEINFLKQRGADRGVRIEYGKNLTDLTKETSSENLYTGVLAYWNNTEAFQASNIQYVTGYQSYPVQNIYLLDCSQDFESTPSTADLDEKAQSYITENNVGLPKSNIKVSYVAIEEFAGNGSLSRVERVLLCDTVTVSFPRYNIEAKMKVIATDYNVLLARYNTVTLGEAKSTLGNTIQQQISSAVDESKTQNANLYVASNTVHVGNADMVSQYGSLSHNMLKNGMLRPFLSAGPGSSVTLNDLNTMDSTVNTVLIVTGHNSVVACNTMWIVRRSNNRAFQIGGSTGTVTVTCSSGTITVASGTNNVNVYYCPLDGANIS